jgi:uncharacterized membrane protein YraQ (UPF0718 family)
LTFLVLSLSVAAAFLFVCAYRRGDGCHRRGILIGATSLLNYIPLLILAFIAAGLVQVVIPAHVVNTWLGPEAGWRGILIGTVAGGLIPGGPYVSFPLIASVYRSGAGLGTVVALVTSWALLNPSKLPFELALLGPRFTLARISLVVFLPPLSGFLAQLLFASFV